MENESSSSQTPTIESNLSIIQGSNWQVSEEKTHLIVLDSFSQHEASRQIAAICRLLLLALARDFGVHSPETITIVPSENTRGVKLRITRRD